VQETGKSLSTQHLGVQHLIFFGRHCSSSSSCRPALFISYLQPAVAAHCHWYCSSSSLAQITDHKLQVINHKSQEIIFSIEGQEHNLKEREEEEDDAAATATEEEGGRTCRRWRGLSAGGRKIVCWIGVKHASDI